jgi:hypothetical protein
VADRLGIYNGALRELGERALGSLSESRASRRYLDTAWANGAFVNEVLSHGQWLFARRSLKMEADPNLVPQFGWQFANSRPTDYIRAMQVCSDEFFAVPLESYQEENAVFYTAISVWYLGYISNDTSYGGNLAAWPDNFTNYVEKYLARKILPQLTGNKTDKDQFDKDIHKALTRAQSTDAMEQPTRYPPPGRFVEARMRGRAGGGWDRGSRNQLIG